MQKSGARKTVLVVDDESQVLAAIEDTLESEYRVLTQTSPAAAIRVVEREPELAVILSDQRMPGMTGDAFLAQAQRFSDASRVLITGYADMEAVIRAVNEGHIFGYISKPWNPAALKLAVYKAAEHNRLLRDLSEEKRLLHNLMDNIPDAIFFKDRQHRFVRLNRAHAGRLGVERPEDAVGKQTRDFFPLEQALEREAEDEGVIATGLPLTDVVRRIPAGAQPSRWTSTTKAAIRDDGGSVIGLVGISRDITDRQEAQAKVTRLNRVYAVLSGINGLITRVRDRGELYREACRIAVEAGEMRMAWIGAYDSEAMRVTPVAWHGHVENFLGLASLSLKDGASDGRGMVRRVLRDRGPVILNDIANDESFKLRAQALERGYLSGAVLPLLIGEELVGVLGLFAAEPEFFDEDEMRLLTELAGDISFALDHIAKNERLDYLAYYDAVTGLSNRTLFLEHLGRACADAQRAGYKVAVIALDIERFRTINDTFGRQAGDALLKQVAGRISAGSPGNSQIARLGADHFAIMVSGVQSEDEIARRNDLRLGEVFGQPYRVAENELRIGAKVGIAMFPADGMEAEGLLRNAEAALRKAKRSGERSVFYQQEMTARVGEHLRLENRLRQALERREFVLHYQPKIDAVTRRIVGMEALIRWMTPEGELVPPVKFISLMEETGLILEVGAWAMRKAVEDHRDLAGRGIAVPRIAVNVSAVQLRKRDFVETVKAAIEGAAACIDLEVTESLLMEDMAANVQKLRAIRELGLDVAIDDFGTGYSSLAYLAKLPVTTLKIDRSFINTMLDDVNIMTLISTMISLAHSLGLKVVAEGVESEEQARMLMLVRCDQMQGYLFSKPMPLAGVAELLVRSAKASG